jgi:hypothetical protein
MTRRRETHLASCGAEEDSENFLARTSLGGPRLTRSFIPELPAGRGRAVSLRRSGNELVMTSRSRRRAGRGSALLYSLD